MTRICLRYLALAAARWLAVAVALVLLVEISFCVVGDSPRHVWSAAGYGPVPRGVSVEATEWPELVSRRSEASFLVLGIAWGGSLLVGYSWGILAGRFRRLAASTFLSLPFSLFACVPGFWFVVSVAIYSYVVWKRPGFADELVVAAGPDILPWWNAAIVALPALAVATSWQLRSVSAVIEREAARPFVRGLYLSGYGDEAIFYENILRRAVPGLVSLADRSLPVILGSLVVLEWAFRYEGMGALLVDSVRLGWYPGIFASGLWMATLSGVATMARQVADRCLRIN